MAMVRKTLEQIKSEKLDSKSGSGVLIRYSRVATEPEVVVQYSIPIAKDLYRLNGVVPGRLNHTTRCKEGADCVIYARQPGRNDTHYVNGGPVKKEPPKK